MLPSFDFEKPIIVLENQIAELRSKMNNTESIEKIAALEKRLNIQLKKIYSNLTAWQKTQVARHPSRPHFLQYIKHLIDDFIYLGGDRNCGDDKAIIGGIGRFQGQN